MAVIIPAPPNDGEPWGPHGRALDAAVRELQAAIIVTGPRSQLSRFSLQLPVRTGTEVIDTISRDALVGGYSSQFFQPTSDGAGFRFDCPVNGVTTSGSSFPRTEMREVNADGSNAGWTPADGKTRRYAARYRINHLPSENPGVTLFQVHNGDTEVVTFRTTLLNGTIRLACRKNGTTITTNVVTLDYRYGTDFTIDVSVNTTVTVRANGAVLATFPFTDLNVGASGLFYIKGGCYLQATPSTVTLPNDYGEVEIRDINFTTI